MTEDRSEAMLELAKSIQKDVAEIRCEQLRQGEMLAAMEVLLGELRE